MTNLTSVLKYLEQERNRLGAQLERVKGGRKLDHWGGRKLGQEKCWNGWNEVF